MDVYKSKRSRFCPYYVGFRSVLSWSGKVACFLFCFSFFSPNLVYCLLFLFLLFVLINTVTVTVFRYGSVNCSVFMHVYSHMITGNRLCLFHFSTSKFFCYLFTWTFTAWETFKSIFRTGIINWNANRFTIIISFILKPPLCAAVNFPHTSGLQEIADRLIDFAFVSKLACSRFECSNTFAFHSNVHWFNTSSPDHRVLTSVVNYASHFHPGMWYVQSL